MSESEGAHGYICEGCQTETDGEGGTYSVDKERNGVSSRETAETLARIHAIKTGHNPEVF